MQLAPLPTLPRRLAARGVEVLPGTLACVGIAVVATIIGRLVPLVGAAVPAIVLGIVIAVVRKPSANLVPGIGYSSKFVLQCAVVLLGSQLSLRSIIEVGVESLPVMLTSLVACLLAAWGLGRWMGVDRDIRTLIGVGTGICGASAIAAVSPIIRARSSDISYAISTVFLFNILAVVVFPPLGHLLGMSPHAFGLFAGTAVNDTSSVVAAAGAFSTSALAFAVVVKLVRTLMIVPISITLAVLEGRRASAHSTGHTGDALAGDRMTTADAAPSSTRLTPRRILKLIPWFLVGFLVVAAIASTGVFPPSTTDALTHLSVFGVTTALAGIGLSTDPSAIRNAGVRPLALGGCLSLIVMLTTLATMTLTGHLGA